MRGLIAAVLALGQILLTSAAPAQTAEGTHGVVLPARSWEISPAIDGKIKEILFTESQFVHEGDTLIVLDDTLTRLQYQLAQSRLELARKDLEHAKENYDRQQKLKEREAVSAAAFSDAFFEVEKSRQNVEIADLEASIVGALLEAHQVHAPADGIMSAPKVAPGTNYNLIESGPVAKLVVLDPIHVRATMKMERVLDRLANQEFDASRSLDVTVELILPNGLKYPQEGRIASVGFELDSETGEGSVLIAFPNPRKLLRPGMPVQVIPHDID